MTLILWGGASVGPYWDGPKNLKIYPNKTDMIPPMTTEMATVKKIFAVRLVCACRKPRISSKLDNIPAQATNFFTKTMKSV